MPLYRNYTAALTAYNEIEPAACALKEAAYADVKLAFQALAAPLTHTQDRLWDLRAPTGSRDGAREQGLDTNED